MSDPLPPLPPPTADLRDFVALAGGRDAAFRLIEHYGGTPIYVPHKAESSGLVEHLGLDLVEHLARTMAGSYLDVPLARAWRVQILRSRGLSRSEIARATGMTVSGVKRCLSVSGLSASIPPTSGETAVAGPMQMDLFSPVQSHR